jgi:hypothetical protein
VTECCTVVQSTAIAMDVPPVSINNIRYLQTKWRTPKAGVVPIDAACQLITKAHCEYGSIRGERSEPTDAEGEAA